MELDTGHRSTRQSMRSNLASALSVPESTLDRATPNVGMKLGSCETALKEPAITIGNGTALSFIGCFLAVHTVMHAAKGMSGAFVKSGSDDNEHKARPSSKTFIKLSPYTKGEIAYVLDDLSVMTKAYVEAIVESRLTKWTSTLQSFTLMAVESTFEDALHSSYLSLNNGLKTALFKMVEQKLCKVVRSGRAPTLPQAKI